MKFLNILSPFVLIGAIGCSDEYSANIKIDMTFDSWRPTLTNFYIEDLTHKDEVRVSLGKSYRDVWELHRKFKPGKYRISCKGQTKGAEHLACAIKFDQKVYDVLEITLAKDQEIVIAPVDIGEWQAYRMRLEEEKKMAELAEKKRQEQQRAEEQKRREEEEKRRQKEWFSRLAQVEGKWVYPNDVDRGRSKTYDPDEIRERWEYGYDLGNIEHAVLAFIEAVNNRDADLLLHTTYFGSLRAVMLTDEEMFSDFFADLDRKGIKVKRYSILKIEDGVYKRTREMYGRDVLSSGLLGAQIPPGEYVIKKVWLDMEFVSGPKPDKAEVMVFANDNGKWKSAGWVK